MSNHMSVTFCLLLSVCAGSAQAQWIADATVNTPVAVATGDQTSPVMRPSLDGGVWIAYADNALGGSGYKHVVQRLTATGFSALGAGTIMSPSRTNSGVFTYDMRADNVGGAVVAFDNNGVFAQRVDANGNVLWPVGGVQVTNNTTSLGPRVAALADGSYVVAWNATGLVTMQRITSSGALGTSFTISNGGNYLAISDLLPGASGGEVIAWWVVGETTSASTSRKGLRLQKWNGANAAQWNGGAPVAIYTSQASPSKSIQNGYFPAMISNGNGGAIVAWYDNGAARNAWLQAVSSSGQLRFAAEGLAMSTTPSTTELRLSASVAYDQPSDSFVVSYVRSNTNQSMWSVNAQRVSSEGLLLWGGGSGQAFTPMAASQPSFVTSSEAPGPDTVISWLQAGASQSTQVFSLRANALGETVWLPSPSGVGISGTPKGRLAVANTAGSSMLIASWVDGTFGVADIKAQNILPTGRLGPGCDAIDFNENGVFPEDQDVVDFFNVLAGSVCFACGDIDFNNNGVYPEDQDVIDFFAVLAGSDC